MSSIRKLILSRRAVYLEQFARAVHAPSDRSRLWVEVVTRRLCLVLFELPRHVQIGLAVATIERYLPTFERRHPSLTQLREFTVRCLTADPPTDHDVDSWYVTLSQEDRDDNHVGRKLVSAVSLVAEAAAEGAVPMTVTSASVLSVYDAIGTGYWEAWEAFDPEAAELSREDIRRADMDLPDLPRNPLQYRNRFHPEVLSAVYAGWKPVVAWLRAANIGQYPDPVDRPTLARLLQNQKNPLRPIVLYPPHAAMVQNKGKHAALALATGGEPDLRTLEQWAEMIDEVQRGVARGTLSYGLHPTEEDVRAVRHLVQLVRDDAPRDAIVEAAWRVYRFTADPEAVWVLHEVLPWLADKKDDAGAHEEGHEEEGMTPDLAAEWLDDAAAFCERGGNVRGFVPSAEDLSRIRRLRELVTAEGEAEVAERRRLAKEMLDRLPPRWWDDGPEAPAG